MGNKIFLRKSRNPYLAQKLFRFCSISYRVSVWYLRKLYPRLAPEKVVIEMEDGTSLLLHPRHDYVQREIFLHAGEYGYERHIAHWLSRNIKPGMTTVEVGSHIGYYIGIACKNISSEGRAFFIEPLPDHFESLAWGLAANGFTCGSAHNLALSNTVDDIYLYPSKDSGRNSIVRNKFTDEEPIRVRALTLDAFANMNHIEDIDLLQIDVEGAEVNVIQGGWPLIQSGRVKVILCEWHPDQLRESFSTDPLSLARQLVEQGFEVYSVDVKTSLEQPVDWEALDKYQHLVFRLQEKE